MKVIAYLEVGVAGCVETKARVDGDIITVDGLPCDLSAIGEGDLGIPDGDHPFAVALGEPMPATRSGGVLHVAIRWVYDPATADPDQGTEHPVLTVTSGAVPDPVRRQLASHDPELETRNGV